MNPAGKKFIALFLVFSLFALSGSLYAKERRGAKLIVTKKDGQQIEGELITVKPNSLLLLDTEGKDVSVDIRDIKVIRIVKKSKALLGAGLGLLVCGGAGASLVFASVDNDPQGYSLWPAETIAAIVGISFGIIGLIIGGIAGLASGKDKTIQIEGMTDIEIKEALDKLRKKARIRDYK